MDLWDVVQQVQIQNLKARQHSGESSTDWVADKSRARDHEPDTKIGRLLLVSYTARGSSIRILSARRATRHEATTYAQGI